MRFGSRSTHGRDCGWCSNDHRTARRPEAGSRAMTRQQWRRRARQLVLIGGFGFALGALADAALTWRLHHKPAETPPAVETESAKPPRPDPKQPVGTSGAARVT